MPSDHVEIRPAEGEDLEQLWRLVEDFAFSYRPERAAFERSFSSEATQDGQPPSDPSSSCWASQSVSASHPPFGQA